MTRKMLSSLVEMEEVKKLQITNLLGRFQFEIFEWGLDSLGKVRIGYSILKSHVRSTIVYNVFSKSIIGL